ncbi:hypothetical protein [Sphingobacterium siyangense]|uniref:hypothetical protein n=1 Tax=Sphingobacterium siyangense TaxID=459529 RepID=UPI003DA2FBF2
MKEIDNLSDLLQLHDIIERSSLFDSVNYYGDILEIQLTGDISEISADLESAKIEYDKSGSKSFEVKIDRDHILLFLDEMSLYDGLNNNDLSLIGKNIFIWTFDTSCLLYENFTIENAIQNTNNNGNFLLNVVQYRDFLKIFLNEENQLIELNKVHPRNEIFIASRGDEKLLVKLGYDKIIEELYHKQFEFIDIKKFSERIKNDEWLACFKNTVCAFFDQQSESKRTFRWLYENFAYLFANTEKSYFLYISKFSFDKISRQFKKDREHYFNSLGEYQNKLSGQLISIPLTIGAALLSNNFVTNNGLANNSVIFLISAYVIFVMGTIFFILFDLRKLKNDINGENNILKEIYTDIYDNFKKDFAYILNKSKFLIGFGIFLLLLFIAVLLIIWFAPISSSPKEVLFVN